LKCAQKYENKKYLPSKQKSMFSMRKKCFLSFFILTVLSISMFNWYIVNVESDSFENESSVYIVVDTGQTAFYDGSNEISMPDLGEYFYGQDAQYVGVQPAYWDNSDGTVTDLNTGLMWQKNPGEKMTYTEAVARIDTFDLAGYTDWRLPSIKELYSLIQFNGIDPSGYNGNTEGLVPFINSTFFEFSYGNPSLGERIIDSQFASSSLYVGDTEFGGGDLMFGVNFADGRIKGYPIGPMQGQEDGKLFYVLYVRGNGEYRKNNFLDNGDGTVTDLSTGLMWQQEDSKTGMNWEDALILAENLDLAGYDDWRLPNAKELQSIVDYSRSPSTQDSAAIDPVFQTTTIIDEGGKKNYPFYWTSTTHENLQNGGGAVYIAFGETLGWIETPSGDFELMDVHGSGAQRSDPKNGNPADYPYGQGPQGDVIRIYNYVRCVRGGDVVVVPEFSSLLMLPILITTMLAAIILQKISIIPI
jgi:hypothetical protein